jgi:UDP-glucuronate 4-epimerase
MRILVTGAAGFVGSHLTSLLALQGHEVQAIDNLNPYYSPELKKLRATHLLEPLNVLLTKIDLVNQIELKKYFADHAFDAVIHLAAQPGVRTPLHRSNEYIANNVQAFTNLLQEVVELEIPYFLYASSSSVYGNSKDLPYSEFSKDLQPVSIYGSTKRSNELLAPSYVRNSKTRARGLRFFTVYGPWGRPDMAYFRLINSGINNSNFSRFGDGQVKRDFTFISDITEQISILLGELTKHPNGFADIVNIGGGNPHSLNDLINEINQQLCSKIDITTSNIDPNDTLYTCADVSLQRSLTGFVPQVSLAEGITKTIAWAKNPDIASQLPGWVSSTI